MSMAFGGCLPTSQIELILMGLLPFGIRSLDTPYGENMLCLDYNTLWYGFQLDYSDLYICIVF